MDKQDLLKELSEKLSMTQKDCNVFLSGLTEVITKALQRNESVKLPMIGCLKPVLQASRPGRNPRTGTVCVIPQRQSARLKVSQSLIDALNSEKAEA